MAWGAALLGLGLLAGCAHEEPRLEPAVAAQEVSRAEATTAVEGVHVDVDAGAWDADPKNLDTVLPLKVTVRNESGHPLRVRFREFALMGPQGSRLSALPPLTLDGVALVNTPASGLKPEDIGESPESEEGVGGAGLEPMPLEGPVEPDFEAHGYYVSPTYGHFWRGLQPWAGSFPVDPVYYDTYLAQWPVNLPTEDMLRRALPEGVVVNGGEVSGFLYFQDVPPGMESVSFQFDLVDADTGQQFGSVRIPFQRRGA
jgi:hypothetical protein